MWNHVLKMTVRSRMSSWGNSSNRLIVPAVVTGMGEPIPALRICGSTFTGSAKFRTKMLFKKIASVLNNYVLFVISA